MLYAKGASPMSNTEKALKEIIPHLKLIREKLWEHGAFGRVSLMIGAGFSRNATRRSQQIKELPTWKDLAVEMAKTLYPYGYELAVTSNPLRLASEYEAAFGTPALEEFLLSNIRDDDYYPSDLHKKLLDLPWADVFTTNYETLLERTQLSPNKKYDLVSRIEDISKTKKPRIVKLHGSFPSTTPFIFTEEHYRRYPVDFAPFVNMVQESLMENTFCLVGFSGDDPNFLKWTGWVRDNLGEAMPKIYLLGILDLSEPQRKLMEKRNVIPLDMSSSFPKTSYPLENERHREAMAYFLNYMAEGEPIDNLEWSLTEMRGMAEDHISPEIQAVKKLGAPQLIHPANLFQKSESEKINILMILIDKWKQERAAYPGWIVAPSNNMNNLWEFTSDWIPIIFANLSKMTKPKDLHLLYEFNWRLEKTLTPLFSDWIGLYEQIIEQYNPCPRSIALESPYTPEQYPAFEWEPISKEWMALVFAMIREAREDLDKEKFSKWTKLIESFVALDNEWTAHWHYEQTMFNIFHLNIIETKKSLAKWPCFDDLPDWELKRASILAELGDLDKAETNAEAILKKVRSLQQPEERNLFAHSLEGWAMMLLSAIKQNDIFQREKYTREYRGRWKQLEQYACNPFILIKEIASEIETQNGPNKEIKKGFDPGRVTITHRLANQTLAPILPAFHFLKLFEEGALPLKCGRVGMWAEEVGKASQRIENNAFMWAIISVIRSNDKEMVEKWFNRLTVAAMEREKIDRISPILVSAWEQNLDSFSKPASSEGQRESQRQMYNILTELISRFLLKFTPEMLTNIYETFIRLRKSSFILSSPIFKEKLTHLTTRLFISLPEEFILSKLSELLSLPIAGQDNWQENERFPEPFGAINWYYIKSLPENYERASCSKQIKELIEIVAKTDPDARQCAIMRLFSLYRLDGLTKEEKKGFAEAIWTFIDKDKKLPKVKNMPPISFLDLPEPEEGMTIERIREWLLHHELSSDFSTFPLYAQREYFETLLNSSKPLSQESQDARPHIAWTQEELEILLEKLLAWEKKLSGKIVAEERFPDIFGTRDSLNMMLTYFTQVINEVIHMYAISNHPVKSEIRALIEEIHKNMSFAKAEALSIRPGELIFSKEKISEIEGQILSHLVAFQPDMVSAALKAIYYLIAYSQLPKSSIEAPPRMLNEVINKIYFRRQPALDNALEIMIGIVENFPATISMDQANEIGAALQYMLSETEYPKSSTQGNDEIPSRPFAVDDILEYRKRASLLAFLMTKWYTEKGCEIPDILMKWKERSLNDPLPEIWKVWRKLKQA